MELDEIACSQLQPAGFVLRAKIVLLLAEGYPYDAIKNKLDTTAPTIARWKKRFLAAGMNAGAIIDQGAPRKRRFLAVQN